MRESGCVSVYVCSAHMHVFVSYVCGYVSVYESMCIYMCVSVCVCLWASVLHVFIYICGVCVCVCVCISLCICMLCVPMYAVHMSVCVC